MMKRSILVIFLCSILICFVSIGFAIEDTAISSLSEEGLRDVKAPVYFPPGYFFLGFDLSGIADRRRYGLGLFPQGKKQETRRSARGDAVTVGDCLRTVRCAGEKRSFRAGAI